MPVWGTDKLKDPLPFCDKHLNHDPAVAQHVASLVDVHEAPEKDCTCGIYCYYNTENSHWQQGADAQVKAWGKIRKGSEGFKAQHVQITHVRPQQKSDTAAIQKIAKRYGAEFVEHGKEWPATHVGPPDLPSDHRSRPTFGWKRVIDAELAEWKRVDTI
jgi:hypothetical protein